MPTMTHEQVYRFATQGGGLSKKAAIVATAIAAAESGLRSDAVGDVALQNSKWGPSLGLWQIRSLNRERGRGTDRDATRLKDPLANATAMSHISKRGTDWTPWSTYNNGAYKAHMSAARAAANGRATGPAAGPATDRGVVHIGGTASVPAPAPGQPGALTAPKVGNTGWDYDPLPGGSGLPGYGDDLARGLGGAAGGAAGDVAEAVGQRMAAVALEVAPYVLALGLGASLIALGVWRTGKSVSS